MTPKITLKDKQSIDRYDRQHGELAKDTESGKILMYNGTHSSWQPIPVQQTDIIPTLDKMLEDEFGISASEIRLLIKNYKEYENA